MSVLDFSKVFSCPRCGAIGAIYLLKIAGTKIIIKQRCPLHGGRSYKLPHLQKEQFISYIRDAVFRCYKCGREATVDNIKVAGPWTLSRVFCPVHGNKLPYQKIWSPIYAEISKIEARPQETQEIPPKQKQEVLPLPSVDKIFCPNCGSPLKGIENFCGICGAEIRR
ncbi:MAG: zinc-ribbon domain-containing protein [Candidatus Odinarchaeota archaeon]